ncbi:MAG: DUF86 domain-containing protein [Deltaproteobacteria bacterium]|nr:DUF86 domain-containing protein [Deltaproteobacteria bacterium]MBN2673695.1 DUF86 domain-containing protein [Deltaproteobacteria bacterium]
MKKSIAELAQKKFLIPTKWAQWCLHHIVTIGEAASRVSESFRKQYGNIPWRRIVAMRNAVVHGYFKVDWTQVWVVVEKELTPLQQQLTSIFSEISE